MAEQLGLCRIWLETLKTGFLSTRLNYSGTNVIKREMGGWLGTLVKRIHSLGICYVPNFRCKKICCNQSKFQTKRSNHRIICLKDTNGMANSEELSRDAV